MWQVAVAAAVAGGSGLLAKRLFSQANPHNHLNQQEQAAEIGGVSDNPTTSPSFSPNFAETRFTQNDSNITHLSIGHNDHEKPSTSTLCGEGQVDGVFRFSSSGSPPKLRKSWVLKRNKNVSEVSRREIILDRLKHASADQRKNVGKRVLVSVKRRKTSRTSKERDSASSKDHSAFGLGLGLGLMYVMSAGQSEVGRLSKAIDETTKIVHELKCELNKQQSSQRQQLKQKAVDTTGTMNSALRFPTEQANTETSPSNKHALKRKIITRTADSEYASSVLTEEHHAEGVEMDQLEAELESELQKLPWSIEDTSEHTRNITNATEIERHESTTHNLVAYQSFGVSPVELKTKLSDVLIKQQESHIFELESELNLAYSKLKQKEIELLALKDCVKRLTEFSLSTISDEEIETCSTREENVELDCDKNMGSQTPAVGMKRPMAVGMCEL